MNARRAIPDAAAQATYDAGRIPGPTVDAFRDTVKGDLPAVSKWKNREIDRIDAETAQGRLQVGGNASSTTVANTKFSIREARQAIRDQNAEHPEGYTNRQTGNVAFINGTQVREMTTETSIAKTMRHGFSTYEHLHAVAVAPTLYETAPSPTGSEATSSRTWRVIAQFIAHFTSYCTFFLRNCAISGKLKGKGGTYATV